VTLKKTKRALLMDKSLENLLDKVDMPTLDDKNYIWGYSDMKNPHLRQENESDDDFLYRRRFFAPSCGEYAYPPSFENDEEGYKMSDGKVDALSELCKEVNHFQV
jgi:hypothetical protein